MKRFLLLSVVCVGLMRAGSATAQSPVQGITYEHVDFRVWLPRQPVHSEGLAAGKPRTTYRVSQPKEKVVLYEVSYAEFGVVAASEEEKMLDAFLRGMVSGSKGKLIHSARRRHGDFAGVEFVVRLGPEYGAFVHGRGFLVGSRIYCLMAVTSQQSITAQANRFFDSFQITSAVAR